MEGPDVEVHHLGSTMYSCKSERDLINCKSSYEDGNTHPWFIFPLIQEDRSAMESWCCLVYRRSTMWSFCLWPCTAWLSVSVTGLAWSFVPAAASSWVRAGLGLWSEGGGEGSGAPGLVNYAADTKPAEYWMWLCVQLFTSGPIAVRVIQTPSQ